MSKRKQQVGPCRICGDVGTLSFEHVPPRKAFNERPVVILNGRDLLRLGPPPDKRGEIQQRGSGGYTLCTPCNNDTGGWYGKSFIDWCYQGAEIWNRCNGHPPDRVHLRDGYPLAVIKQIACMFFSTNGDSFHAHHPELVKFVLDKNCKGLPPHYRFFTFYMAGTIGRHTGVVSTIDFHNQSSNVYSEITFPPYGYVLLLNGKVPHESLTEITHFTGFDYGQKCSMEMRLPTLPVVSHLPGDYRSPNEIAEHLRNQGY